MSRLYEQREIRWGEVVRAAVIRYSAIHTKRGKAVLEIISVV